MKIVWRQGQGPSTTQELADLIKAEGRLITKVFCGPAGRCLWGVIYGAVLSGGYSRSLDLDCFRMLKSAGLRSDVNDNFVGTPEERCIAMARICRAIP